MNTGKTLFAQLMNFLPWSTFDRIVARYNGNRAVRTLPCAAQYQAISQWESEEDMRAFWGSQKRSDAMAVIQPFFVNQFTTTNCEIRVAVVLSSLGRNSEALAEIEALAPVLSEVKDERHPDTLATRHLRARVLGDISILRRHNTGSAESVRHKM